MEVTTRVLAIDPADHVYEQGLFVRSPSVPGVELFLGQSKYFEIHWSDDRHYLAVSAFYLTHNASLTIYQVEENAAQGEIRVALLYASREIEGEWIESTLVEFRKEAGVMKAVIKRHRVPDYGPAQDEYRSIDLSRDPIQNHLLKHESLESPP